MLTQFKVVESKLTKRQFLVVDSGFLLIGTCIPDSNRFETSPIDKS